jgi:DNA-binding MarR family transcriptional regulator
MNAKQVSERDIEIAARLRTVIHRLVKILRKEVSNKEMLSLTERSTLSMLYQHASLLPSELAAREKVTTQSMSQVINHLYKLGYIHKGSSPDDKRKVLLTLTPAGKAFIDHKRLEKEEWLAGAISERISREEKDMLVAAMGVLAKLVEG